MQHQSSKTISHGVDATLFDPAPPFGRFVLLGPALVGAGVLTPHWLGAFLFGAGIASILLYDARPRRRRREMRVVCKPGALEIPGFGELHARDLVGATTAHHEDGVSLVLAHKGRERHPIALDLANEDALATVCKSLGIGHHGFGHVDFPLRTPQATWLRLVSAIAGAPFAFFACWSSIDTRHSSFVLLVLATIAWSIATMTNFLSSPAMLRMTSGGIFVPLRSGSTFVPFNAIEHVAVDGRTLVLTLATTEGRVVHPIPIEVATWARQGSSMAELERMASQVRDARDRAHGKFAFKPEPHALVAQLHRQPNESLREWLARLDVVGVGTGGYRATAFDAAELWTVLEDPDADADLRSAAARILSHASPTEARVRIVDVLATVRDDRVRSRIAASMDESALAEEERHEARRSRAKLG